MRSLMRFFFYHFYHSLAWSYDMVAALVSLGRWKSWARAALPHLRGTRILELGFGPGHLQVELNRRGFQTLGLDESPQMIGQTRRNLTRNQFPVRLLRGYAQNIPLRGGCIDSVVATFPSEYIIEEQTLADIARVLTPGGRLVIVPTAWLEGDSMIIRFIDWLFAFTGQAAEDISEAAQGRLTDRLAEYGFRVEIFHEAQRESVALVVVAEKTPSQDSFPISK